MRLFLLFVLFPVISFADDVADWARTKVHAQKEGLTPAHPPGEEPDVSPVVWRERTIIPFWKEKLPGGPSMVPSFTPPTSLAPLVRAVRAGVVNISAKTGPTSKGMGSGFVITSDGLVVTNNHVI